MNEKLALYTIKNFKIIDENFKSLHKHLAKTSRRDGYVFILIGVGLYFVNARLNYLEKEVQRLKEEEKKVNNDLRDKS